MHDFRELYGLHSKELFNYLLHLTRNYTLAEELLQETFFQAFTSISRFKGEAQVRTWLYQIAKYIFYNEIKKNHNHLLHIEDYSNNLLISVTPESELEKKEDYEVLYYSLHKLKEPYRDIVILRLINELKFKEIGEIYCKSENWARVTFHRGKIQLLEIIKKKRGIELED